MVDAVRQIVLELGERGRTMSYPDGTLLKGSGPEVYLVHGNTRRQIPDTDTFNSMGYQWDAIQVISDTALQGLQEVTSLSTTALDWAGAKALLQSFAPYIWLHSKEAFFPASVNWYMPRVKMIYPQALPGQLTPVTVPANVTDTTISQQSYTDQMTRLTYHSSLSADNPLSPQETAPFYLQIQSEGTRTGMATIVDGKVQSLNNPPVYGTVIDRQNIAATDLLYGFFYAYNGASMNDPGFYDTHEGDWEHVIVCLNDSRSAIEAIFFQAHGLTDRYSQWYFPPGTPDVGTFSWYTEGRRFVVYSSRNGHASYTASGNHSYSFPRGTDETDQGTSWDPVNSIIVIDPTIEGWMNYSGCFGTYSTITTWGNPPPGPIVQGWLAPNRSGPVANTTVTVSVADAQGQESRVSQDFTLLLPNEQVVWHITGIPNLANIPGITFTVMEDKPHKNDQPRLENVKDGTISAGTLAAYDPNRLYIGRLSYTESSSGKTYNHTDVFTQLGVTAFTITITAQ